MAATGQRQTRRHQAAGRSPVHPNGGIIPPSQAETAAKLSLNNITKSFAGKKGVLTALSGIDLSIGEGEFACIVGPSGCGKTTLLNILAGLEKPDSGEILPRKTDNGQGGQRLMIFQEAALFPWLTVWENVAFGLKMRGVPKRERKASALAFLSLVELERFAESYIHELSGGMKQRVALARVLVLEPEVLLMDEPFNSLDIQAKELLYQELQEAWHKTGTTILFITHDVQEAVCLGDRVIVLSGRPGKIRSEYRIGMARPRRRDNPSFRETCDLISSELLNLDNLRQQEA